MIEEETKEILIVGETKSQLINISSTDPNQQANKVSQEMDIVEEIATIWSKPNSSLVSVPSRDSVMEVYTHYIFFAANPRSGDQKAADFLNK